jgi:hypothetical protein
MQPAKVQQKPRSIIPQKVSSLLRIYTPFAALSAADPGVTNEYVSLGPGGHIHRLRKRRQLGIDPAGFKWLNRGRFLYLDSAGLLHPGRLIGSV